MVLLFLLCRNRRASQRTPCPELCAAELSYSHSDGRVEDKSTFIANATNGKSKFLSLEYLDPQIRVVGTAAIVRFHWVAESQSVADRCCREQHDGTGYENSL